MLERFYQLCPSCGRRTRSQVISRALVETAVVESSKRLWSRSGNWPVDEPVSIFVYSYDVTHRCRACGNQWAEKVTKQRLW